MLNQPDRGLVLLQHQHGDAQNQAASLPCDLAHALVMVLLLAARLFMQSNCLLL